MKINGPFILLFLVFSKISFADGNSYINNFNEYVNLSDKSSDNSTDKIIYPSTPMSPEVGKNPEGADSKPALRGIPAKWQGCATDSDCTAGVADCVSWEALNKEYLPDLFKDLSSCSASIDPGFQPEAVCAHKQCEITEKNTNVSYEEWLSKR